MIDCVGWLGVPMMAEQMMFTAKQVKIKRKRRRRRKRMMMKRKRRRRKRRKRRKIINSICFCS